TMHRRNLKTVRERRGQALVLTAILMPVLVGFVALAVDIGGIATAKAQLQTAADAAALAGARQLASDQRLHGGPVGLAEIGSAQTQTLQFASANKVLGGAAVLLPNASNANTGNEDLVVGYLSNPFDPSQPLKTDSTVVPYFNTVLVRASRSASHG